MIPVTIRIQAVIENVSAYGRAARRSSIFFRLMQRTPWWQFRKLKRRSDKWMAEDAIMRSLIRWEQA